MLIVVGPFRSGTSLVSALLSELGADFGPRARHYPRANRLNPLGYFQLPEVVAANRALLRSAGVDLAHPPSADSLRHSVDPDCLRALPSRLRLPGAIKDPRFALTLACWLDAGALRADELRLVVVERDTEAVARSVLGHREVAGYCGDTLEGARAMTVAMQEGARWHAALPGIAALPMRYEAVLADPPAAVARLADWLGGAAPARQRRATALVGKHTALRRHYLRKAVRPADVALAAWKSLRMALVRA